MNRCSGNIKRLRKEEGLTQVELAKKMKITDRTISRYEKDQIKRYTPDTVSKFSQYFDVDESEIWQEDDDEA